MTLAALLACSGLASLPTATIQIGGHPVTVEIAATRDTRAHGLMDRDPLGADHGMLFVYPDEKPRTYWMKSTRIPLTIAYADRNGEIVKLLDMAPYETEHYQSLYPAMYAVEMDRGWFATAGVKVGDRLTDLPTVAAEP